MKPTVLIVDDEKSTRDGLRLALEDKYETFIAKDATEAARLMQDVKPDGVLTDLRMAGEDGMAVIDRALKLTPQPVCIMMTAYGDVEIAVKAMSKGAYWFLQKPVDLRQLEIILERGLKARTTEKEVVALKTRLDKKFLSAKSLDRLKPFRRPSNKFEQLPLLMLRFYYKARRVQGKNSLLKWFTKPVLARRDLLLQFTARPFLLIF
jgi:DNA-binding NtrC family response regulator